MYKQDYILNIIAQAIAALQQALGLRTSGNYQGAINVIEHALEGLFDMHFNLIYHLDDERLLKKLEQDGELDYDRALVSADLFREAGTLHADLNRPGDACVSNERALRLYLECALGCPEIVNDELKSKISQLVETVEVDDLSLETQFALTDYYEYMGELDQNDHYSA